MPRITVAPTTTSARVDLGMPRESGGTRYCGLPGVQFSTAATRAHSTGQIRYYPLDVRSAITLTGLRFEVTTAPAADGNTRVGLYAADTDWQPTTAAPIFDVGVPVATGFVGVKTATVTGTLQPGRYLLATAVDQAMTLRAFRGGASSALPALGASPFVEFVLAFTGYGPMPTPGARWSGSAATNTGTSHAVLLEWSTPLG
jgi:hypothetical protein